MSQKFTSNVVPPPADLSCNVTLSSALKLLREILSIQDGNVAPMESRQNDFQTVLSTILGIFISLYTPISLSQPVLSRSIITKLYLIRIASINGGYERLHDQLAAGD